jgi:hypothetical protein
MSKTSLRLNPKQYQILLLAYKFRFITTKLLAGYKQTSTVWTVQKSLTVLVDNGYLYKRYNRLYKIDRKPATYHLSPKALKVLKDNPDLDYAIIHARYKDKSVGQNFIDHHLQIFQTYLDIKQRYPEQFKIFTKAELRSYEHLPEPLPDLYLAPVNENTSNNDVMIDIFSNATAPYLIRKRIDQLITHYDECDWQEDYPDIHLLVPKISLADSLNRYIAKSKDERYIDKQELVIFASIQIGIN